ncbi:uncharacterized protein LOC129302523 [Prosopis cineraria]|uniref:uncharacterized protein LOC129302523 n=1 Tax=Prosopis cineraria TaxID=364024 RepID=UPI0024101716|nr:uncharacterized protein LOC129302523 [Prosopis cineraria]
MDKEWMSSNQLTKEYLNGVKEFIKFALEHTNDHTSIVCPCVKCCLMKRSYKCWHKHGETRDASRGYSKSYLSHDFDTSTYEVNEEDQLEEMARVIEEELKDCPEMLERLKSNAEKPFYSGYTEFTLLSGVLSLYNLKASSSWSDKSFSELLALLKVMLPKVNELPINTYQAKQMLLAIDNGKSPEKALWYFPIVPRFRRLYSSKEDAKNLTWHADERIKDGKLQHPANSLQWGRIDHEYPEFGQEARNLRLALCTDGMNPHGLQSSTYSTWPVILIIYNLPPWLCMKRKYMMLSMLILGPKQPENDIDMYLAPLVEDFKLLWEIGVEVYDGYREEKFNLRALLFGTINDFPAYGNLSGYSIKGKLGCPICEENTYSIRLEHGMKNAYMGHRRWLHPSHNYRQLKKCFNGNSEERGPPLMLIGNQLFEKVKDLYIEFGKPFSKHLGTSRWK